MKVTLHAEVASWPGPSKEALGERRLWCAVIAQALNDLHINNYADRFAARDARAWIGSRGFREVCLMAGVDADAIAAEIERALAEGRRLRHYNDDTVGDRRRVASRGPHDRRRGVAA